MEMTFRQATHDDLPALWAALGTEPSDEQLGLVGGDVARGRKFRKLMMSSVLDAPALERTTVAVSDGQVAGFLQSGAEAGGKVSPALVWGLLRIFGPMGIRGFLRREKARARTGIPAPAGAYHIAEMHVLPSSRNLGIGAALLAEAERDARAKGYPLLSLTTTTTNPARHLYERMGYTVVETREDPEHLANTGVSGRILMTRPLS
jgi:ribosomal protein S18 acetylase RimI-like enzyme